jgi:5-hydroxyisourate hydrolase
MSTISTHVLDTSIGRPAAGVRVTLATARGDALGSGVTDADGRAKGFAGALAAGTYRLTFDTGAYFAIRQVATFYPEVSVVFQVAGGDGEHYHVPLLVSPFGYSTYRGS